MRVTVYQQPFETTKYEFRIEVNGKLIHNIINTKPAVFENLKFYASDPWHRNYNGRIRHISIKLASDN